MTEINQPQTPEPEATQTAAAPPEETKPARVSWLRRFKPWQFSLRTLLVLMAIASGICWYYLLPKRHEEKLAGGYLILKREYRGKGSSMEPVRGPGTPLTEVFHGENDGYWRLSDFQGRLLVDGHYRKGKEDGWWTTYHPNGRKAVQGKMWAGERTGVWKTWATSGQVLSEVTYNAEVASPDQLTASAKPASQLHGAAKYWHENGKPSAAGGYQFNLRSGKWSEWNEQGELTAEGTYVQGKKHGTWRETADGQTTPTSQEYVHGLKKELLDAHLKSLAERLEKGDISERLTLISVAAEFGEPALKLFEKLVADNSNQHVQLAAIAASARCGGDIQPRLRALEGIAKSDDARLAMDAQREIYRHFPDERRKMLPALLKDAEQMAESSWIDGLQQLRELFVLEPNLRAEIFPTVLQITAKHVQPDPAIPQLNSAYSAHALASGGPNFAAKWQTDVVPYLKEGLDNQDKQIRLAVVSLIRQILVERNETPSPGTYTTERWKIPANIQPLVDRARQDSDSAVQKAAEEVDQAQNNAGGFGGGGGGLF